MSGTIAVNERNQLESWGDWLDRKIMEAWEFARVVAVNIADRFRRAFSFMIDQLIARGVTKLATYIVDQILPRLWAQIAA
ncbi:hypothetical protein JTB14_002260 [Gonioctena quinquepunctata]|nr:hypothetical protein JTB14_002260 [Gonioctena quinquepunctata]